MAHSQSSILHPNDEFKRFKDFFYNMLLKQTNNHVAKQRHVANRQHGGFDKPSLEQFHPRARPSNGKDQHLKIPPSGGTKDSPKGKDQHSKLPPYGGTKDSLKGKDQHHKIPPHVGRKDAPVIAGTTFGEVKKDSPVLVKGPPGKSKKDTQVLANSLPGKSKKNAPFIPPPGGSDQREMRKKQIYRVPIIGKRMKKRKGDFPESEINKLRPNEFFFPITIGKKEISRPAQNFKYIGYGKKSIAPGGIRLVGIGKKSMETNNEEGNPRLINIGKKSVDVSDDDTRIINIGKKTVAERQQYRIINPGKKELIAQTDSKQQQQQQQQHGGERELAKITDALVKIYNYIEGRELFRYDEKDEKIKVVIPYKPNINSAKLLYKLALPASPMEGGQQKQSIAINKLKKIEVKLAELFAALNGALQKENVKTDSPSQRDGTDDDILDNILNGLTNQSTKRSARKERVSPPPQKSGAEKVDVEHLKKRILQLVQFLDHKV